MYFDESGDSLIFGTDDNVLKGNDVFLSVLVENTWGAINFLPSLWGPFFSMIGQLT